MKQAPMIKTKRVILRRPIDRDIHDRLKCGTVKEIERMYGGDTRNLKPYTLDDAKSFIDSILSNKYEWCVEFEGRCIGQARLTVNESDRRARYAVGLFDPSVLGKGLGTEVTQLILQYAFEELNLHRVDLRVLEYNHRAIACYKRCGFIQEGVEREGAFIEDCFQTDVMMSILDREYKKLKNDFVKLKFVAQ